MSLVTPYIGVAHKVVAAIASHDCNTAMAILKGKIHTNPVENDTALIRPFKNACRQPSPTKKYKDTRKMYHTYYIAKDTPVLLDENLKITKV